MLQFNKLRLTGFKSFVENTELHINLGLTGVVGPNGCGKSNLVEALRWVMGETSAKQMRGAGMDDVIFGGTASRPQRNTAEVVLALDNTERTAPAVFNDEEQIDVSRKIERDKGSTFRVNGKEVRARDVHLLFADSSTGARSTALVSQGRIGSVVNSKPQQRRILLEEAAGITGLHSRRHEAELRLNGAKTNLERLDDVLITLDTQLKNLKKQSRQANRYTNLSDHIREAEATLFHLHWRKATALLADSEGQLRESQTRVGELTKAASRAATYQASKAETLPAFRTAEATAAAELYQNKVARENLAIEEKRIQIMVREAHQRIEQISMDQKSAEAFATDAKNATQRLYSEKTKLETSREDEVEERNLTADALTSADAAADEAETALNTSNTVVADIEARRNGLSQRITEMERELKLMALRGSELEAQRNELQIHQPKAFEFDEAEYNLISCEKAVEVAQRTLSNAEITRLDAEDALRSANADLQDANSALTRFEAEKQTISNFLEISDHTIWTPLIDTVRVKPGYETALGVALGEDLNAPANEAAPVHWRTLLRTTSSSPLPPEAIPMSDLVEAPPALTRRLQQIGVVETDLKGKNLASKLVQGQRLVSCEGGLWRWDGYTVSSQAITPTTARLAQRNRLIQVGQLIGEATDTVTKAKKILTTADEVEKSTRDSEHIARDELRKADQKLNSAREKLATQREKTSVYNTRMQALEEALDALVADQSRVTNHLKTQQAEMKNLPDLLKERDGLAQLRTNLAEIRANQVNCRSRHEQLERATKERNNRLEVIAAELRTWHRRDEDSKRQLEVLSKREQALRRELSELEEKPVDLENQRQRLMDAMQTFEAQRNEAADALAKAETALQKADRDLKDSETELFSAREQGVRFESAVEQAKQACTSLSERIFDRLSCSPNDLFEISGLNPNGSLPDLEASERKVERLMRERETMGPVNLRAQQEAEELSAQIKTLNEEREDLLKAISKLRHGISELNREGRDRLVTSFEQVDKHFQELFIRLFGGGQAHLALTESDDPLEAGLEIMASPPGKKLQVLSLLSGGEQALTALALLFGVFLTNPAPICVLDEVDAPLDDANVDRFCTMLEEMAKKEKTRFLVITHHRMTMARMDRLFGVTMQERGISQLVSVDLEKAEKLRDIA